MTDSRLLTSCSSTASQTLP